MKFFLILLLSTFLYGCACLQKHEDSTIPPDKIVHIDSELLLPCDYLDDVTINSFGDSLQAYATISTKYGTCAIKQLSSIKLLKKLGNIP